MAEDVCSGMCERALNFGKTPLLIAVDGHEAGVIAVADTLRPTSAEAGVALRRLGLRVVLLTGDSRAVAETIGRLAGID